MGESGSGSGSGNPDLGVLFVHGIGEQAQGDTLTTWSDGLVGWLRDWLTDEAVSVTAARVRSDSDPIQAPYADVWVDLPSDGRGMPTTQSWRLAESWWAEEFRPPRFRDLAFWGFGILPWAVVAHFVTRFEYVWSRTRAARGNVRKILGGVRAVTTEVILLVLAIMLSPLLASGVLIILLLGALPIRALRQMAASLQRLLSITLGDSYALLSPTRRASIVSRVRRDLASLASCSSLAVIAHSQGAAIAHEALRAQRPRNLTKFITFGSGQAKLSAIDRLRASRAQHRVWLAPMALFGLIVVGWQVMSEIRTAGTDTLIPTFIIGVTLLGIMALGLNAARHPKPAEDDLNVHARDGWLDLYAGSDPVSNGSLFGIQDGYSTIESVEIQNFASWLRDHTAYWRNRDDFVPRLAVELARSAGGSTDQPRSLDAAVRRLARARRRWRVRCLRVLRVLTVATFGGLLIAHWNSLRAVGRWAVDATANVGNLMPFVQLDVRDVTITRVDGWVGVAALAVLVGLGYLAIVVVWTLWDRADYQRFVGREPYPLWAPEFVALLYTTAGFLLLAWFAPDLQRPAIDRSWLFLLVVGPVTLAIMGLVPLAVFRPVAWALIRMGLLRPGHGTATTGQIIAVLTPVLVTLLVVDVLPGKPDSGWLIATVLGGPVVAAIAPPVMSSSQLVGRGLRRLRMWAVAEPVSMALWHHGGGPDDTETVILAAEELRDGIERRVKALHTKVLGMDHVAEEANSVQLLTVHAPLEFEDERRKLTLLTAEAEEVAEVLHEQGHSAEARLLLRAAALYSRTAAIRLYEIAGAWKGSGQLLQQHAEGGSLLGRARARRTLEDLPSSGVAAPLVESRSEPAESSQAADPEPTVPGTTS